MRLAVPKGVAEIKINLNIIYIKNNLKISSENSLTQKLTLSRVSINWLTKENKFSDDRNDSNTPLSYEAVMFVQSVRDLYNKYGFGS